MNSWTITLPPELAEFVKDQLAKKAWDSADNLFAAAVYQLLHAVEVEDSMDQDWLRAQIQMGIDSANRGELIDGEEVFAQLERELDESIAQEAIESNPSSDMSEPQAVHVFPKS